MDSRFLLTSQCVKKLGIAQLLSYPYHCQTNGMMKHWHSMLKGMLGKQRNKVEEWDFENAYHSHEINTFT